MCKLYQTFELGYSREVTKSQRLGIAEFTEHTIVKIMHTVVMASAQIAPLSIVHQILASLSHT